MTLYSREFIEQYLLQYLAKRGEPTNWYPIEQACSLPRNEFPEGTNIMTFLEDLKERGLISETVSEKGHPRYSLTADGLNSISQKG